MGAPKQKWTAEEEAALKAGIVKHGAGKWRTILIDPEFSDVLRLRSNVDLKDKWRNLNVMTNGFGSRDKSKLLARRIIKVPKHEIDNLALSNDVRTNEEIYEIKPLAVSGALQIEGPKRTVIRWEDRILEAIATLDVPGGSNRTEIGAYIEEHYSSPPNFTRLLSENLKLLIAGRRLIKVKHKYRIPKTFASSDKASLICHLEGSQRVPLKVDKEDISIPTKSEIDSDLSKMKSMNPEEAAAFAARAVAEAEAAIAEAEAAEREADAAEADAEAAKVLEEAAMKTLKGGRSMLNMMIQAS